MFDIGFTEMMVIAVIALVVIGPERLPRVARQTGQWIAKMRRYVDDVKSDFHRQVELSELKNLKSQVEEAAKTIESSVSTAVADTRSSFESVQSAFESTPSDGSPEPVTNWDAVYAVRRSRERIKDRRIERERSLGFKRPRRPLHR